MTLFWILIGIAALLTVWSFVFDWEPIDSWRFAFRRWSTWLHGTGMLTVLPAYLGIWNQMPGAVQRILPSELLLTIGFILWVAGALAVYVKQRKLDEDVKRAGKSL